MRFKSSSFFAVAEVYHLKPVNKMASKVASKSKKVVIRTKKKK
jgi:hypothetical protein